MYEIGITSEELYTEWDEDAKSLSPELVKL
jgi:hypothetical protein